MEVVGSEIGQKMRSAIKAKLTELGCYVDDELPDYVMVMVANKRTRAQMEDDLQLFLGDNTELFVNWLHQVLKKLQEVTVTAPLKQGEQSKEKSLEKEKKHKEKKDKQKSKKSDTKKKKRDKGKSHHKKDGKKSHKSKKKSKHHGIIRPNVPPLLMNIEKESEPSITDVFAGQILKNHGVNVDSLSDISNIVETKPTVAELKRPLLPIIDPASITSQVECSQKVESSELNTDVVQIDTEDKEETMELPMEGPREDKLKEMNEIEAKIQGLKQKLTEQLDSMSDDEDFLNIRTEAEELMNDFAEDVFQEISANVSSPKNSPKSPTSISHQSIKLQDIPKEPPKEPIELPQIELNLPKRPVRERLGAIEGAKKPEEVKEKATDIRIDSPERFTPEREPDTRPAKSAKSRLGDLPELRRSSISDEETSDLDPSSRRLTSKVTQENRFRGSCASVVRVRPRPRVAAPASSLLLRAVADAQKSLMNIPPKPEQEPQKVKRALVLPMRRNVDPQKILIQVGRGETDRHTVMGLDEVDFKEYKYKSEIQDTNEEYAPTQITKKIINTDYVPPRTSTKKDDTLIVETINIHHQTVDKEKDTQFIVTMDGYHLNALLAKKLMTEGLLDEDEDKEKLKDPPKPKEKQDKTNDKTKTESIDKQHTSPKTASVEKKRLSNTSEESDTHVVIQQNNTTLEKRKGTDILSEDSKESLPVKKRKASPIVFSVEKAKDKEKEKEKEHERRRTESAGSDNHVTVTTNVSTHKYDAVPPLSTTERKPVLWCRTFPMCRFGSACAYAHPRCKFAAACTRRNCMYSHAPEAQPAPVVASHVVPAANYKTISAATLPTLCKFYPNCVNPACHFYHPKPCRYGKACINKLECNFYHSDVPATKFKYPV